MSRIVYLDNNASTPMAPSALHVLTEVSEQCYANASSGHRAAKRALEYVAAARLSIARLIGADPSEIYFTSGATESLNLAILGLSEERPRGGHIITSTVEHPAVFRPIEHVHDRHGTSVTALQPDSRGVIDPKKVRNAIRDDTVAVVLMHGNNEIGTITDFNAITEAIRGHPALLVVDAAQTSGYFPPQVDHLRIDLMCLSSHKMHGPKGVGALYCRNGLKIAPVIYGGGQEHGLRSGTLPVPLIASFAAAADLALADRPRRSEIVSSLRDRFLQHVQQQLPDVRLNGERYDRLPSNLSLTFPWVEATHLQAELNNIAFSRGSACSTASGHLSHVLKEIGLTHEEIHWTVRLGFSYMNSFEEIDFAASEFVRAVKTIMGN